MIVARDEKERRRKKIIFALVAAILLIVVRLLMPPPYDEKLAENVLNSANGAYVRAGHQYETLHALTDCAENNPADFSKSLHRYKNHITLEGMTGKNALRYLSDMMDTGKVMPWSGKPMNHDECAELIQLPDIREEEYKLFSSVLEFVMSDDYAQRYYGSQYPKLLNELLEVDANIASALYQIVCVPHLTGKYGNNSTSAKAYANLFMSVPGQNKHLTGEDVKQSRESLTRLKGIREECLSKLNSLGVFDAYSRIFGTNVADSDASADIVSEKLPELEGQPEDRMLNDLFEYIYSCKIIYDDVQWALDYTESFDRARSWDSLQMARAAAEIATSDIRGRNMSDSKMTSDDFKTFIDRGIDVEFFGNFAQDFKADQQSWANTCFTLSHSLIFDTFLKDNWEICISNARNNKKLLECFRQALANIADWTLASFNDPALSQKLNDLLAENCPEIHALQGKELGTPESIEASSQELMNYIEKLLMESRKLIGASANMFYIMKDAIERKGIDSLSEKVMKISDMPPLIHYPEWLGTRNIYYWWQENGEIQRIPLICTQLTRKPDGCRIITNGVSLEKVKAYQKQLEDNGLSPIKIKEEDGTFTAYYKVENSNFAILWRHEEVIFFMTKNPVCLVPNLYLYLMLKP